MRPDGTMIHLRLRTEYSFRRAYGRPEEVLGALRPDERAAAAITDNGTWGHVAWWKACRKAELKPILGVEVLVVPEPETRERQTGPMMALLARNRRGLRTIYKAMTWAHERGFYYVPRLDYDHVNRFKSDDVVVLSGHNADIGALDKRKSNIWLEMNPASRAWNRRIRAEKGWNKVIAANNFYPHAEDHDAYEIIAGHNRRDRITGAHIPSRDELALAVPEAGPEEYAATEHIAGLVTLRKLPKAKMVKYEWPSTLEDLCRDGIKRRDFTEWTEEYEARLRHELDLIESKGFTDYFQVITAMVMEAKETMLVGPARGSAAGSLACFLLGITDVDPLVHDLMFERFIDVTRSDYPDIDLDFPDRKRDQVIGQLAARWGETHVGRIGTVSRYKPKSALTDVARELNIPPWEVDEVKGTITERSSGDERAAFAVADALDDTEIGRELIRKHPGMALAGKIEGHARHSGMHAAGVLVTERPLTTFATIDRGGSAQIDKKDAEALDMLKIDCLGLRTLSVLEDTLEQIGKPREWLVNYPLDDEDAFEVLNAERYAGIFQFEGYALQALCRQMKIREFSDIASITALARPGPLHCGAANDFVLRRLGQQKIEHIHPILSEAASDSFGTVIYQEQVMKVCRTMGQFSWEDVTMIRRIMSKSFGDEFFAKYWAKFREGAVSQGVDPAVAQTVWDKICTFGSWAFNKSHAVSYGLISYWCAMLKAHYPLEFGAACLRNAKDDNQALHILRELVKEGYEYTPVDPERSGLTWQVHDGRLVGGLTNVKGIGAKKAADIIDRRASNRPLTPGLLRLLNDPITPFDHVFEAHERFGDLYEHPEEHKILSGEVSQIADIHEPGEYVFIGRIMERKLRDMNEAYSLAKRGGRRVQGRTQFLNMVLEDDSGQIIGKITRDRFPRWGLPIVEQMRTGDYCLFKGVLRGSFRLVFITQWRYLEDRSQVVEPVGGAKLNGGK